MRSGILLEAKYFPMQILQWVQIFQVKFAYFESDSSRFC